MIRFITLFISLLSLLYGQNEYQLQLLATKSSNQDPLQKMIKKANSAGLSCYQVKERHEDGLYYYIRCNKTNDYKTMKKSVEKAKLAGLKYYIHVSNSSSNRDKVPAMTKKPENIQLDDIEHTIFGENRELINILHNQNKISKEYMEKRKKVYLHDIRLMEESTGLYLKGYSSRNLTKDKMDYNIRLEWDILDSGFYGSKEDAKKVVLQKELDFDKIMDEYHSANLKLSLYKMEAIKNNIKYNYLKQQEKISERILNYNKKRYEQSLITASEFFEHKKAYDNIKHTLFYYKYLYKEPYDTDLKPLISRIEDINMVDMKALTKQAYLNSFKLNSLRKKEQLSSINDTWTNRLKTNIYVENKKHYFLEDSDTVAGVQVQIPLDYHVDAKDRSLDIEMEANRLKEQSIKLLIAQNIKDIYHKIEYHKTYIQTLKDNINFFQNELKLLKVKLKYPLAKQNYDPKIEQGKIKLSISKQQQEIWQERTEVLKLLLELQHICGIQVLPS
jgi:hypothetical protein